MPRLVLLPLAAVLAVSSCAWSGEGLDLEAGPVAETSRVYAADGTLITTLHAGENRETVPLARIPPVLQQAVVATEDQRFWAHKGVDLRAVARAAMTNASEGRVVEGGSTITQQYVKNELLGSERDVRRKLREASLAYQLEQRYSKERILELYLNTIYFGNGAYGVEAAAQEYFGKPVDRVGLAEAALLASLIYAPSAVDPFDRPEVATERRRVVLEQMQELGLITAPQAAAAAQGPLGLRTRPADQRYPAPHFVERVKRFVLDDPRFGATPGERRELLFTGGLRIHTTLDLRRQGEAEEAVARVLSDPGRDPDGALVALEPGTGYVRALVGGRQFFDGGAQAKFDLATQGARPAGSSFKPFVLAAALEEGIPLAKRYDAPGQMALALDRRRPVWRVRNYEGQGGGAMDLREATALSINTVYAQLILDVGPDDAVDVARRMGVASPLAPLESAVLGTNDVTALDMAAAYATFANRGVAVPPAFVTRIVDARGGVLYQHRHDGRQVLDPAVADTVNDVLREVMEAGTGVAARIGRPAAGKTGTGQQWRDAWFVGFTPDLVTSVWVGFPDQQRSMVPPTTRTRVTGGGWPAQIWQLFMTGALAEEPVADFHPPPAARAGGEPRVVPAVVGMPGERAEGLLGREGFRVRWRSVANDEYPPGYVIAQSPDGQVTAPAGSTVVLTIVAEARAAALVPDVLGLAEGEARSTLTSAGFSADVVVAEPPEGTPTSPGRVWRQSPAGGSRGGQGSGVTVWVAPAAPAPG